MTPSVIAILITAMIASYSASLFMEGKPRVNDYSMLDSSRVVRMILTPAPLLFEAPSTFKIHSLANCFAEVPGVNLAMKYAMTCPLIDVLVSYLMLYCLNSHAHFAIRPVNLGFSMIFLRGCFVTTVIKKD